MSTTDAFLLAVSSAVTHDLLGGFLGRRSPRTQVLVRLATTWIVGAAALVWAWSPPELLTRFYTAGVGLLSAGLFVPVVLGLWWRRANRAGGVWALVVGSGSYVGVLVFGGALPFAVEPIVAALPLSLAAMVWCGLRGRPDGPEVEEAVARLHRD